MNRETIPIFFAIDNGFTKFLAVALQSLLDNASKNYDYSIKVLHTDVEEDNIKKIKKYERSNVNIEFVDLNYYIEKIKDKLYTRDYYSSSTYFRLFIPELYPQYNKAIYLDCDIAVLGDISELYNIDLKKNLVAAAPDDIIQFNKVFQDYAEKVVGVAKYQNYFNAGILLMNLDELRKFHFQEKFCYLLGTVKYSVAQDQDYLNRLCKGRTKIIGRQWDVMPIVNEDTKEENIKIVHYNFAYKPWHFEDVPYNEYFWKYAKKTEFYNEILKERDSYTEEDRFKDREAENVLRELAQKECDCVGDDRYLMGKGMIERLYVKTKSKLGSNNSNNGNVEKSPDRLEILEEIERLEREGKFDVDPEKDPPTIELTPDKVDYLRSKGTSRLMSRFANKAGELFLNELLRKNKLIIKEVNGIENLNLIPKGAIITCNHFNPFDSFTVEKVLRSSGKMKKRKLYKVIREGNYTNFPGFYGFLFRNCDTLPLSSNLKTMTRFMKAVEELLNKGNYILIYPEQSLWWNYKKPKPLKNGAFKLAAKNKVPVLPIFITMKDSDIIGADGFPVQEYIVNLAQPIFPDENLSVKQNEEMMKNKNFEIWKEIYEDFYKIPLTYTTITKEQVIEDEKEADNLL